MSDDLQPKDIKRQRAHAARTAWVLGFIAVAIFVTFISLAMMGR